MTLLSPVKPVDFYWSIYSSGDEYFLPLTVFALQVYVNVHNTHYCKKKKKKCLLCGASHRCVPALVKSFVQCVTLLNVKDGKSIAHMQQHIQVSFS